MVIAYEEDPKTRVFVRRRPLVIMVSIGNNMGSSKRVIIRVQFRLDTLEQLGTRSPDSNVNRGA